MRLKTPLRFMRAALALLGLHLAAAGCDGLDLVPLAMEVNQAIQTPTNTIPLVAQRSTTVRVTVYALGTMMPVPGVTGKLHVYVNSVEITPVGGLDPINGPITAALSPMRNNENDTLNYELPAPTGITASSAVTMRVDVAPVPGEVHTDNNSLQKDFTFVNRDVPLLFYTRINYTPSMLGLPSDAFIQPGTGDAFVRGIFPVNDSDPNLYRQGLFPSLTYSENALGDGILNGYGADGDDLLSLLASCRQLIVSSGIGASDRIYLYGWLAGNPINGNGLSQKPGHSAFGNTDPIRGQRSYAHELTHNFGLDHNSRNLDQIGWDVGPRLPSHPTGNNTMGRLKGTSLSDIQVAGLLTNQAWVDTVTYNYLLSSHILGGSDPSHDQDMPVARVAVVQGIFDPTGQRLISLKPVFRYPWASTPPVLRKGTYAVDVADDKGGRSHIEFDGRVGDDSGRKEEERFGAFEVMVPVAPDREISSLTIRGARVFVNLKRGIPPVISIIAPKPGAALAEKTVVAWDAVDMDSQDSELMYQIAYSPNGGRSFVPLMVDIPGNTRRVQVDTTEIQKSDANGLIRVFVSDGLNTAFADVGKLVPQAAKYPPEK